jgi:hypothetical protein
LQLLLFRLFFFLAFASHATEATTNGTLVTSRRIRRAGGRACVRAYGWRDGREAGKGHGMVSDGMQVRF